MDNPRAERVKRVAALATRAGRRKQGLFLAEGPQPVREALRLWLARYDAACGEQLPPAKLPELDALYFTCETLEQHPGLSALLDQIRGVLFDPQATLPRHARIFLREATPEVLTAMSDADAPQGIIAVCRTPEAVKSPNSSLEVLSGAGTLQSSGSETGGRPRPWAADLKNPDALGPEPTIRLGAALVGLQDPGNVGTLIRTADAAGAGVVVLTPGTADPWSPKVVRAAAGSHFHLPVLTGVSLGELVECREPVGFQVLAAHGYAALPLAELTVPGYTGSGPNLGQPTVWLLGNEAHGLSADELSYADAAVSVPLYGQAESLNVAAAGAVCLYASAMAQRSGRP